jgi:hypothetical protein
MLCNSKEVSEDRLGGAGCTLGFVRFGRTFDPGT